MRSEVLFLKYAFPCAFVIRQRGEINEEEFKRLEEAAIHNKVLPREMLERIFFRAFERIKIVAQSMKRDIWDAEVIRAYFVKKHNAIIDEGMYSYATAPPSLKDLCKVHKATVKDIKDDILIVEYGTGKRRPVMKSLVPNAKKGDKVTIHYGYAIEQV